MVEDTELLRRYADTRDEAAFRALVDRHLDFVYNAARRRLNGDAAAAEDVTQLVFAAAARQAGTLGAGVVFPGWLYRTTRNICVDLIRSQAQRRRREQEATAMHEPSAGISPEKLRPVIDSAIDELAEKDRQAIVLRFFSQLTLAQVGHVLRVSEDAARMRVDRALAKLQQALSRRGITSTAAAVSTALANEALASMPTGIAARVCSGALSAGASAPATGIATVAFMSSLKMVLGGATVLLCLGLASFEVVQWRSAAADSQRAAQLAGEVHARLQAVERDAQAAEQALAAAPRPPATRPAEATPARAAAPTTAASDHAAAESQPPWDARAEGAKFMNRHPEVRDALRDYVRARARFSFGPFLDSLHLAPEQRARLEEYVTRGSGMGAPVPGARDDARQFTFSLLDPSDTATQEWARETLGADGMLRLAQYRQEMDARDFVTRIAGSMWNSDAPLSPTQAELLTRTFIEHRANRKYDWDAIAAAASGFLTPTQMAAIEMQRAQDRFNAVLSRPARTASTAVPNTSQATP